MSFSKIAIAVATSSFLFASPVFAQAPDQPTGRSDTKPDAGMKKSDMMKSGDMTPGMMNKGSADHNGTDTLGGPAAKKGPAQ